MKKNLKYIFNLYVRFTTNSDGTGFDLYNPENKLTFSVESGFKELITTLEKFKIPTKIEDLKLNSYQLKIVTQLYDLGFIEKYNQVKYSEYINLWEKNNWEDFLFFLKSIGNYEFVDVSESLSEIVEIKENLFENYVKNDQDFNLKEIVTDNTKSILLSNNEVPEKYNLFEAIFNRRTIRNFNYQKVSFDEFSYILKTVFFEIKNRKEQTLDFIESSLSNFTNSHSLWLNAMISVNNVEDIPNGFYLYDYLNNKLLPINQHSNYDIIQKIIIGQPFVRGTAFSVFVLANFYNIFWRYRYPGTYKAIILSSAELVHKFILTSNTLGLGCFSTPAIKDDEAEKYLKTIPMQIEPIYYLGVGKYDNKKNYTEFAKHYDEIMGDREKDYKVIYDLIVKYNSNTRTILDLACGTGQITGLLSNNYIVEGIDSSFEMINVAKTNYPKISFKKENISNFNSDKKYDCILCSFDSINHLTNIGKWESLFKNSLKNLNKHGILIFDINTLKKLEKISNLPKSKIKVKDNFFTMKVDKADEGLYNWNISYINNQNKILFEENILQTSFEISTIKKVLKKYFKKINIIDHDNREERLYFICQT